MRSDPPSAACAKAPGTKAISSASADPMSGARAPTRTESFGWTKKSSTAKPHTWVGAFVYSHEKDENVFIGALRFKSEDLVLSRKVASFVEVYGRRIPVAEIPKVTVTFGNLKINGKAADVGAVQAVYPKGVPDYANAKSKDGSVVIEVGEPVEDRTDRRVELDPTEDDIGSQAGKPNQMSRLGGKTPLEILAMLGAKGEAAAEPEKLDEYRRIFGFLDANDDGDLSTKEFVEDGRYMTRQARLGIFGHPMQTAMVLSSEEEYVTNRIITDEAKAIMAKIDEDRDGQVARKEFIGHSGLPEDLSKSVFSEFDTDGNGELEVPEYLRVWGHWREGSKAGGWWRNTTSSSVGLSVLEITGTRMIIRSELPSD